MPGSAALRSVSHPGPPPIEKTASQGALAAPACCRLPESVQNAPLKAQRSHCKHAVRPDLLLAWVFPGAKSFTLPSTPLYHPTKQAGRQGALASPATCRLSRPDFSRLEALLLFLQRFPLGCVSLALLQPQIVRTCDQCCQGLVRSSAASLAAVCPLLCSPACFRQRCTELQHVLLCCWRCCGKHAAGSRAAC